MKSPNTCIAIAAAVAAAFFSSAACAQLTNSTAFPGSGDEASRLKDFPSITHRYGNDNIYSRWRATGQWDDSHKTDPRDNQSALPPFGRNEAGRAVKQDGYGEPIRR